MRAAVHIHDVADIHLQLLPAGVADGGFDLGIGLAALQGKDLLYHTLLGIGGVGQIVMVDAGGFQHNFAGGLGHHFQTVKPGIQLRPGIARKRTALAGFLMRLNVCNPAGEDPVHDIRLAIGGDVQNTARGGILQLAVLG